ncbi:MAG: hypothetical protein ACPGNV_06855 [Mangrovicoccus sp.]
MGDMVRVQHLHLRHGPGFAPHMVQSAIEDALRCQIGSLGLMARSGLVVIRRLDLGAMADLGDIAALKQRVAQVLAQAVAQAVTQTGKATEAPIRDLDAPVAVFADPLAPHRQILRALAQGQAVPQSWPYRAVFGRALTQSPATLGLHILSELADQDHAPVALASILTDLEDSAPKFLALLPPRSLPQLVRLLTRPGTTSQNTAQPMTEILAELPQIQGAIGESLALAPADSRAVILAAHWIAQKNAVPPEEVMRQLAARLPQLQAPIGETASPKAVPDRERPAMEDALPPSASLPERKAQAEPVADPVSRPDQTPQSQNPAQTGAPDTQSGPAPKATASPRLQSSEPGQTSSDAPQLAARPTDPKPQVKPDPDRPNAEPRHDPAADSTPQITAADDQPTTPPLWAMGQAVPTGYGGVILALGLAHRAFGDWLSQEPHLNHGSGQWILAGLTQQAQIPSGDPMAQIIAALPQPDTHPDIEAAPLAFHLPQELIEDPGTGALPSLSLRQICDHAGWRMLCLERSGLPIAAWTGLAPTPIRALITASRARRKPPQVWRAEALAQACLWGLHRFLRRRTGRSLAQLCRRPALILASRTHWDVQFPGDLVDLSLRRYGVDLSPGWVSWLMRVVTIHYDFGEAPDHA